MLELGLEHDDVNTVKRAVLRRCGGGGVAFGKEVVGGVADFKEAVDVGVFQDGVTEGGEGCELEMEVSEERQYPVVELLLYKVHVEVDN